MMKKLPRLPHTLNCVHLAEFCTAFLINMAYRDLFSEVYSLDSLVALVTSLFLRHSGMVLLRSTQTLYVK